MHYNIWSSIVFWMILFAGYRTLFLTYDWMRKNKSTISAMFVYAIGLGLLTVVVVPVAQWHWGTPAARQAKAEYYGQPITIKEQNFKGKTFVPTTFVVTEQRILVFDGDGKVYSLAGIKLEGLAPEDLVVSSNSTYTVYEKGGKLFFGKL